MTAASDPATATPATVAPTTATAASDPLTTPIQQSTVLGRFSGATSGFLVRSGALSSAVDPSAPTGGVPASINQTSNSGQLTADLTSIGSLAGTSGQAPADPTAGSQTTPLTGASVALGQPDTSTASDLTSLQQPQGRFGPGA